MTCNNCIHFGVCRLENETPARCQHFMPNLVRCGVCVFFDAAAAPIGNCKIIGTTVHRNDFCNNGEKR